MGSWDRTFCRVQYTKPLPKKSAAVAALLAQVGAHAVAADAVAAESLMRDFGLPPLLVLCKAMPTRLRPLLALVYAFAPDTTAAHIGVIKGLQEALDVTVSASKTASYERVAEGPRIVGPAVSAGTVTSKTAVVCKGGVRREDGQVEKRSRF